MWLWSSDFSLWVRKAKATSQLRVIAMCLISKLNTALKCLWILFCVTLIDFLPLIKRVTQFLKKGDFFLKSLSLSEHKNCIKKVAYLLCILTSFQVLQHLKNGRNTFFSRFSTFFVHFKAFSQSRCRQGSEDSSKVNPQLRWILGFDLPFCSSLHLLPPLEAGLEACVVLQIRR